MALALAGFAFFGVADGVGWALGCVLGSSGPDDAEVVYSTHGGRRSLLVHRTWTHQPMLWIAILWYLIANWTRHPLEYVAAGWLSSGLLHLLMDMLTPMGIPLLWPTAQRTSLNLLKRGASERPVVILVWITFVGLSYVPWLVSIAAPDKSHCRSASTCNYEARLKSLESASWEKTLSSNFDSLGQIFRDKQNGVKR